MKDFVVIGSGIGGTSAALALNKDFDVTLFEKEQYLGGCSSTYKRGKYYYNAGATTFAGYQDGTFLYDFFKKNEVTFKKQLLDSSLTVLIGNKKIRRLRDLDAFVDEINSVFYHEKNKEFYELIFSITNRFFQIDDYYYSNKNLFSKTKSLYSFKNLFFEFSSLLFTKADKFIDKFFNGISKEYLDYIDNQVLIVSQAKTNEINFLTCALALGYQFMNNYYIYGGMGSLFDSMAFKIDDVRTNEFIQNIEKTANGYIVHSKNESLHSKNVILNSSLFDSAHLFEDKTIKDYINKYKKFDFGLSAFMVYMKLDTNKTFDHHYQIILPNRLKNTVSNSMFVSFSSNDDEKMKGSVTISMHTNSAFFTTQTKEKKQELLDIIKKIVCEKLNIQEDEIVKCFAATPQTFKKYINRTSLGGIAVKYENLVYKLPSNDTPIKGLYNVGDTTFAAQGWPGVMLGVRNLQRLICKI
ncbi:phytoene desaturase family protein [Malaciobacter marinus]|jgi:phytoene dehydrogenase-like protein|uniref:phytoene desaturase family protein n=1 Tax=Malaciobacter marinus TaxID=505249 RepID=UPI0009A5A152|nr:NAD(P)-binding protein [Malaciobacter marinus]SKB59106.1 Phytoene dehydrogenase-related protein [Malaciobacter marinus]